MEGLKTKEEILLNNSEGAIFNDGLVYDGFTDGIYTSMNQYAKHQSLEFTAWAFAEGYSPRINNYGSDYVWDKLDYNTQNYIAYGVETDKLYDKFIQHSNT